MKVYLVYAYPAIEGAEYECVDRIFNDLEKANNYKEKLNKEFGWKRATYIDEMEVE
jgi:hypothetical protein